MHEADAIESYEVAAGNGRAESRIKRSRFLAETGPAASEVEARAAVTDLARRHHDCRHVCWAWRGGIEENVAEIRNDGGEPSGSAGEPILKAIRRSGLTDTVAIVARWFGGVKLGTGGLARAYGEVADDALATTPRRTIRLGGSFSLHFPYALQKTVRHHLEASGGHVEDEVYEEAVTWRIWLPRGRDEDYAKALREATAGAVTLQAP